MRKQVGALYRRIFKKSALLLGFGRLPVVLNGRWVLLPLELWDGFSISYEPYVAKEIDRVLRPAGTFVDVGAHIGLWSLYAAEIVGKRGSVVSIEPSPAFDGLRKTAEGYPQIEALNCGLGAEEGEVEFHAQGASSSGSFVRDVTEINVGHNPGVLVSNDVCRIVRLDDLLLEGIVLEHGLAPTVIQIDVEGY